MRMKMCDREFTRGTCGGSVRRVSPHVGMCEDCAAVWYIRRKSRYSPGHAEVFASGSGNAVTALHDLITKVDELEGALDRVWENYRAARQEIHQSTLAPRVSA